MTTLLLFSTTTRSPDTQAAHDQMVQDMRRLAEATPGFQAWYDIAGTDPGTFMGAILFESEKALATWRDDPSHAEVHRRGEEGVYSSFRVQIFEVVRENAWRFEPG